MMRAPAFWWKPAPDALTHVLSPLGALYGAIAARRMQRPGERVGVPVICIGNFVAGGAGKTPTAIALARALIDAGSRPFFLSRGYGAAKRVASPIVVDPASHRAADVGDEPLLLARVAPAVVCADRVAGARMAVANGASVIVMDDGLQNPSLAKDFRLAVVDGAVGMGNGLCIPAGPLRAPLDAQLAQTDAMIVIGGDSGATDSGAHALRMSIPVARAHLAADADAVEALRGKRVLAFAGIGRPDKFFDTLAQTGAEIAAARAFADHHPYSNEELVTLRSQAARLDAALVTTEKDLARIGGADDIASLPVTLKPEDPDLFAALAAAAMARAGIKA